MATNEPKANLSATVAVFGSSEPGPDDALYRDAESLGRRLALAGFHVITGGYGGVMEAASKGAFEAGGRVLGVASALFAHRDTNPYVHQVIDSTNLFDRTRELVDRAQAFVITEGRAGTLSELSFLWALQRAHALGDRPVILLGTYWEPLIQLCAEQAFLDEDQRRLTRVAANPADAVQKIVDHFQDRR